jgi:hypothetical protein
MTPDRGRHGERVGDRFDYRRWAADGFHLYDDDGYDDDRRDDERDEYLPNVVTGDSDPVLDRSSGDQPPGAGERGHSEMADGEFYEPADHAGSDIPNRFDISGYRNGLFGGPGADLFGEPGLVASDRASSAWQRPAIPPVQQTPPQDPVTETGSLVRPYTRTGGRTRSDYDLAIEALVSTSDRGWEMEEALLPEHRSICELCMDTRSVAEVAAHLRLPLGVVRVLIGDMAGMGLVVIHSSGMVVGDRPSMDFLERVLSGLRRL